jgi:hypothetical protein
MASVVIQRLFGHELAETMAASTEYEGHRDPKGPSKNNCSSFGAAASRLTALLVGYISQRVCARLVPCQPGAPTPIFGTLILGRTLRGIRS